MNEEGKICKECDGLESIFVNKFEIQINENDKNTNRYK